MRIACGLRVIPVDFYGTKKALNPLIHKGLRVIYFPCGFRADCVRFFAVLNADFRAIKCGQIMNYKHYAPWCTFCVLHKCNVNFLFLCPRDAVGFPQKHSRLASLGAVAILLVSSPHSCAFICTRQRHTHSPPTGATIHFVAQKKCVQTF